MLEIKKKKYCNRNAFDGLISRLDLAEERISELEGISIESSKTEKQREQGLKKTTNQPKNRIFKGCGTTTESMTYVKWTYQKEKRKRTRAI